MITDVRTPPPPEDRQWFIVGRWQEYEGEGRANLLRIIGIGVFYGIELVNYYTGVVDRPFHQAVTALAFTWAMVGLGVHFCLGQQVFPASLKFLSTAADIVLLTAILMLGDGPKSPLVVAYFLLIVLATLRFRLRLIWFASSGSMLGYLFLLGYARWFTERDLHVARYHQVIFLLTLALTGIVLGQVIRRVWKMALEYAARVATNSGPTEEKSAQA
ncbi:MAG: hypothetical protein NTY19_41730 [Planctomycetota bacterium]|nr:hypothetical protein [Planctomycetota bacterium]